MNLAEVRSDINRIDEELKKLFDLRLECSSRVADVKMKNNDEVYKPEREQEIYSKYSDSAMDRQYLSFIRKVVQLSRKYQYLKFIENDLTENEFFEWVGQPEIFSEGGKLKLELKSDKSGNNGLSMKDIIAVISDTELTVSSLMAEEESEKVEVCFLVGQSESQRLEAMLLSYMLYKETIR